MSKTKIAILGALAAVAATGALSIGPSFNAQAAAPAPDKFTAVVTIRSGGVTGGVESGAYKVGSEKACQALGASASRWLDAAPPPAMVPAIMASVACVDNSSGEVTASFICNNGFCKPAP